MKGKIDKDGFLEIYRKSKFKDTMCPSSNGFSEDLILIQGKYLPVGASCGDWCAQFGEPFTYIGKKTALEICQNRKLVFDKFTDERE